LGREKKKAHKENAEAETKDKIIIEDNTQTEERTDSNGQ
jgi:hypothetical protein